FGPCSLSSVVALLLILSVIAAICLSVIAAIWWPTKIDKPGLVDIAALVVSLVALCLSFITFCRESYRERVEQRAGLIYRLCTSQIYAKEAFKIPGNAKEFETKSKLDKDALHLVIGDSLKTGEFHIKPKNGEGKLEF